MRNSQACAKCSRVACATTRGPALANERLRHGCRIRDLAMPSGSRELSNLPQRVARRLQPARSDLAIAHAKACALRRGVVVYCALEGVSMQGVVRRAILGGAAVFMACVTGAVVPGSLRAEASAQAGQTAGAQAPGGPGAQMAEQVFK